MNLVTVEHDRQASRPGKTGGSGNELIVPPTIMFTLTHPDAAETSSEGRPTGRVVRSDRLRWWTSQKSQKRRHTKGCGAGERLLDPFSPLTRYSRLELGNTDTVRLLRYDCLEPDRRGCAAPVAESLAQHFRQVAAGVGPRNPGDLFRRPAGDDGPAAVAALGPQVDDMIGGLDHVQVVLDDNNRIADVAQRLDATRRVMVSSACSFRASQSSPASAGDAE